MSDCLICGPSFIGICPHKPKVEDTMSVTQKILIEIDKNTVINPKEVTTMEYVENFGASYWNGDKGKFGTIISFNSGRKVFAANKTPSEIISILSGVCDE